MAGSLYGLLNQGLITVGVLGSAWLSNRVWKGRNRAKAEKAKEDTPQAATRPPLPIDDPSTATGLFIRHLEQQYQSIERQLTEAREQILHYVDNNARLKAEKTAAEARATAAERRALELEAREVGRGRR